MPDQPLTLPQQLLRLLFPPRCVSCRQRGDLLCPSCLSLVQYHSIPSPAESGDVSPLSGVRSAAGFSGPLREAVHQFKYGGLRALAPTLGLMLADNWKLDPFPVDLIVPVPLHSSRLRQRGYNQSALLAHELSLHTGLPVSEHLLTRSIATQPQVSLGARDRFLNVRGAFACQSGHLSGVSVLLIDDVITTGATMRACAEELLRVGASQVWGLALAGDTRPS